MLSLHNLYSTLRTFPTDQLPGKEAHQKMAPSIRPLYTQKKRTEIAPKQSAVMILLYEKNDIPHTVLIERQIYSGVHSGQISFPGGKKEKTDAHPIDTGLRETQEEIGIHPKEIEVVNQLSSLYIPPSNFLVHPIVGFLSSVPQFLAQEKEVKAVIEVPIDALYNEKNHTEMTIHKPEYNISFTAPAFEVSKKKVWGATAMIISELLHIISYDLKN